LGLANHVFQFSEYQVRPITADGTQGNWKIHRTSTIRWKDVSGIRALEVRGINSRGVPGPTTVVQIPNNLAELGNVGPHH
jgi:hypothetical protein